MEGGTGAGPARRPAPGGRARRHESDAAGPPICPGRWLARAPNRWRARARAALKELELAERKEGNAAPPCLLLACLLVDLQLV